MDITYTDDGLVIFKCIEYIYNKGTCYTNGRICHGDKINNKNTKVKVKCADGYIRLSWNDYLTYKNLYKEF